MVITKINEIYQNSKSKTDNSNGRKNGARKLSANDSSEDCLSCRLIGSGGVAAIGVYIAYQTKKAYDHNLINNQKFIKSKVIAGIAFTTLSFALAYMRFNDIYLPWTRNEVDS